jgi:Tfp pilus assembly protein PilO
MFKKPVFCLTELGKREKILLLTVLMVLFTFINYRYLLGPQIQSYQAVKSELNRIKALLAQGNTLAGSIKTEDDAVAAAGRRLAKARELFSVNMQDGSTLFLLGQWAAGDRIAITAYQPGVVTNKGAYLELPLEIGLRGDYRDLLVLVKQIEEMADPVEIRYLDIKPYKPSSSTDDGAWSGAVEQSVPLRQDGMVTADLNLVMYSDETPRGQLVLEEMSRWPVGKGNAFLSIGFNLPVQNKQAPVPATTDGPLGQVPEN